MLELLSQVIEYLANLPQNLDLLFQESGLWPYIVIWIVLYLETAVFFLNWLPGNALLMGAAALAASADTVQILPLVIIFLSAGFLGDTTDFFIGKFLGKRYAKQERITFIKPSDFRSAHSFLESNGRKGLLISRFIPVLRSIMPLVSGFFNGHYQKFWPFILGGVTLSTAAYAGMGYFFGNIPQVQENFTLVLTIILVITMIPAVIVFARGLIRFIAWYDPGRNQAPRDSEEKEETFENGED